jgi:hypothetical protein
MKPQPIQRPLRPLERQSPWLAGCLLAAAGLCGLITLVAAGLLGSRNLRGYTGPGLLLGVLAVALTVLAFAYMLRKRAWQERMPWPRWQGTMAMWLWGHVYLGLLALFAAVLHGGAGLISANFSTGKLLLLIFAGLVLSGLAWRLIYAAVPPAATRHIRNYAPADHQQQAEERLLQIEKIAAGRTAEFHGLKEQIVGNPDMAYSVLRNGNASSEYAIRNTQYVPTEEEKTALQEIQKLAASRQRALKRLGRQPFYHFILQGWRALHLPLIIFFSLGLVAHLVAVSDLPTRLLPAQLGGFHPSGECADCHLAIVEQWTNSMHAHALTSPVTVVQTNQVVNTNLAGQRSPDPLLFCNNCHGPVGAKLTEQATLPLDAPSGFNAAEINEGITCAVCHQFAGESVSGGGGLAAVFQRELRPGRVYFGPIADPVGNAFHQGQSNETFARPETLCQNCHNVNFDLNDDGRIQPGVDLILQTTYDEFLAYQAGGGRETCVTCHMPLVAGQTRVAETAAIPLQQDYPAPPRLVRDHSFVGVDYPLDTVASFDPQQEAREALLRSAAVLQVGQLFLDVGEENVLTFDVSVTNNNLGHNLPTGFAFARQMWLEVVVRDENGDVLFESGLLAGNTADLCDADTLDDRDNPMLPYVQGCAASDPQLVNFQQKLVDRIALVNGNIIQAGEETWLQNLNGGAVARVRPVDGQELTRILPNETRTFLYQIVLPNRLPTGATLTVRLLFRNLPPYFLRALADHQPAGEQPQIAPMIGNVQIVEMAAAEIPLDLR